MRFALAIAAAALCLSTSSFAQTAWVGSWGASPSDPLPGAATSISFENQTVRTIVRLSLGGQAVRLRLSNALGPVPLTIGAIHVARWRDGAIVAGTDRVVTLGGGTAVTIPTRALALSDPVALPVETGSDLAISLYFPGRTGPITEHALAVQTSYLAPGDGAASAIMANVTPLAERPVLSAVEVEQQGAAAVVTLGDSITDGQHSSVDANARYPDALARRIAAAGTQLGVVNAGINGNRLLSESRFGPNALSRLDSDVLTQAGVRSVIVLLGINDIGHVPDTPVTTEAIIGALGQIAARGHERGLWMVGGTLLPFEDSPYWAQAGEAMRQAVNAFVRTGGAFDAVADFDAATRDPTRPTRLRAEFDSGDHLHPNDRGYEAMAGAVDIGALGR